MKRLILASAVILGWAAAALGAEPGMLISLRAVHMLNNEQASRATPVAFEATVTYYNPGDVDLFVEDGGEAVYVETATNAHLSPGDRVEVKGRVRASFRPEVLAESVTVTGHGSLPRPLAADFGQLIRAEREDVYKRQRRYGLIANMSGCLRDPRQAGKVDHSLRDLCLLYTSPP